MLAAQFLKYSGDINNIELSLIPIPIAISGYAVIKLYAASINRMDYKVIIIIIIFFVFLISYFFFFLFYFFLFN